MKPSLVLALHSTGYNVRLLRETRVHRAPEDHVMPISHQRDPWDATRFIGLYRQEWETEWLVVKRLGLPYAFNSAEGAEAFAVRRLEADEKAIPTAHKLFGDLLGLWIAGLVGKGSKRPPVHRLLARFVIEQFASDEPFGLPTGRLDDRVHLVPVEMRWPLQFWLLTQATLLLRSELAAV